MKKNVLKIVLKYAVACVPEAGSTTEEWHKQTTCSCNVSCRKDVPQAVFCQLNGVIVLDDEVLLSLPDKQEPSCRGI